MAAIKVHGGSFRKGQGAYGWGTLSLPKEGSILALETINAAELSDVEIATEETFRKKGSALGLAVGGALLLGPLGLFAGALGGKRKEVTFVATFNDGRAFVGTTDAPTFAKLKAAAVKSGAQRSRE